MKTIAYLYYDPLLPTPLEPEWPDMPLEIYRDLGGRSAWQQMLGDCQTTPVALLLIRGLEELGSTLAEVADRLSQLEQLHIPIAIAQPEGIYPRFQPIPTTDKTPQLLQLFSQVQQHLHSSRIRTGHARNRIKALPPPGKAPYGYCRGQDCYTIDRKAAPVVKDFFRAFLLYGSLRGAVRHLKQKYAKNISVTTGRRWLTNPAYRGDLAYQNGEIIPNTHIPIVSREEAAQVDRLLRRNRRLPPRTASAPRSLAGLVSCGQCQSPMTVSRVTTHRNSAPKGGKEYLYLRPTECPQQPKCKALPYQEVLHLCINTLCQELPRTIGQLEGETGPVCSWALAQKNDGETGRLGDGGTSGQGEENFAAAIAAKEQILAQLPDLCAKGILDPETAELRAYKLRTEIAQLQNQRAQLPPVNLGETFRTISLAQFWLDLSEAERRFYFREFIQQIQIVRADQVCSRGEKRIAPSAQDQEGLKPNYEPTAQSLPPDSQWQVRIMFIF
ncbi:MAG TPA: recombinase family protein [Oscillatoriaceae cyanobacterium M33_DOE_052]|uniref:Recombinase family protein n=1 Tax=Planktothricoides sp. SpSt-374 TaxID=2282167 RepID=A0A7C3ZPM8_9CYAN|nr:recombinase family protein [Oscillatoriaceae cyanobacterium M33_DOE_052]